MTIDPELDGVKLSAYAAVTAFSREGIDLAAALSRVGIDAARWPAIDRAWSERLAEDGAGEGELVEAFDRHRRAAATDVVRPLPPLDEDLRAWLDFYRTFTKEPDPLGFLEARRMHEGDVMRLVALWGARLDADPEARELAASTLAEPAGPLPEVAPRPPRLAGHVEPAPVAQPVVTPQPVAAPQPLVAPRPVVIPEPERAPEPEGLDMERYAALCAELAAWPDHAPAVHLRFGLDDDGAAREHWRWRARLDADPAAKATFEAAYRDAYYALAAPPPAPGPRLTLAAYASLLAEIAVDPSSAMATIARYGLRPEDKRAEDSAWQARFEASPDERAAWLSLVAEAKARLSGKRR